MQDLLEVFIRRLNSITMKRRRHEQARYGRGERIRTSDPCVPNAVRYRAALRPDKINRIRNEEGLSYIRGSKRKPWASATPRQVILPSRQVHPFRQPSVCSHGLFHSLRGQTQQIRKRGIRQRDSRRTRNNPRHIGHTIVEHSVHHIDRVRMGRGFRGFEAAALIDRDVHHHGSRLHARHQSTRDQFGRSSPRNEHRPDDKICSRSLTRSMAACVEARVTIRPRYNSSRYRSRSRSRLITVT